MANKKTVECPNNEGVYCAHTADCENCGWNPIVAIARLRIAEIEGRINHENNLHISGICEDDKKL